jgi:4-hydroxy-tetrahydrodipicolinate reductase
MARIVHLNLNKRSGKSEKKGKQYLMSSPLKARLVISRLINASFVKEFTETIIKKTNVKEMKLKVALIGLGKAGMEVARYLLVQPDVNLISAFCRPQGEKAGKELGELLNTRDTGIIIHSTDDLHAEMVRNRPDVVIDFSTSEGTLHHAEILSPLHIRMVVATTGFSNISIKRLKVLTRKHGNGLVFAPNITTGVNVLMLLSNLAAGLLSQYDFRITEMHHSKKKDSPSGTAKKIANEIVTGLHTAGVEADLETVPIQAIRAGGVVGIHEVIIVGEQDQIKISHESFTRRIFAEGALKAAKFVTRKTGWFEMKDTLHFDEVLTAYLAHGKDLKTHGETLPWIGENRRIGKAVL